MSGRESEGGRASWRERRGVVEKGGEDRESCRERGEVRGK